MSSSPAADMVSVMIARQPHPDDVSDAERASFYRSPEDADQRVCKRREIFDRLG
jgi:hypothetical protein